MNKLNDETVHQITNEQMTKFYNCSSCSYGIQPNNCKAVKIVFQILTLNLEDIFNKHENNYYSSLYSLLNYNSTNSFHYLL